MALLEVEADAAVPVGEEGLRILWACSAVHQTRAASVPALAAEGISAMGGEDGRWGLGPQGLAGGLGKGEIGGMRAPIPRPLPAPPLPGFSMGVPMDRLIWEMLVAGLRPDAGRGAAAVAAFGYAGGLPVAEISEALAASGLEAWPAVPEVLATASALARLPAGARVHLTTLSPGLASALADVPSSDLPPWLRRRLSALLAVRRVVVETSGSATPRMVNLIGAAKAALPYARPLAEVEARMAGARA